MKPKEDYDDDEKEGEWSSNVSYSQHPSLRKLTTLEKKFLLAVEHGDASTVGRMLSMATRDPNLPLDINCKDPVGRSATLMSIDNENLEMLEMLLESGAESRDALLHSINAEYVEAVDLLLEHEEIVHKEGEPHSWEKVDHDICSFAPEITPLILAAHKDNYEILKLLLDRGSTLPVPHDIRCRCGECVQAMKEDCLCHSRSRINAYRALSSPSLICLSSIDPILTAFELSWELRRLSFSENEFKEDYQKLRIRCQDFANCLLDHARSSRELGVILNHDPTRPSYQQGDQMPLTRVEMAINYKQKKFIAHPNVQQLLSSLWYEGLPSFRKMNSLHQLLEITKIGVLFPFYSVMYMILPKSKIGSRIKKPFYKFIIHSFSYLFFLFLLILASQRTETLLVQLFGTENMKLELMESMKRQRGQPPTIIESAIFLFICAYLWQETKELWTKGIVAYFQNMWNLIDTIRNLLHVGTACMRVLAYFQAQAEIREEPMAVYIPREAWDTFDPMLIADGFFAAGNVFAALKLVHIFSINPYLGPLQISLGRMVIDIIKFFFIYTLVLFAFACGLNQLLWYYADMERKQCYSGPDGKENWLTQRDACLAWRSFSNLFETSQTLFWASFGLIDIGNFQLTGIKGYTRFWGLMMFGSYSVINVVVLLNLLIAMMSNSYQIISERSDVEWKFARTALFMNYFEEGGTVPPPFNIFPTLKNLMRLFSKKQSHKDMSFRRKETKLKERDVIYQSVMCNLVWRYVTAQQKACESHSVTEDDINELRQEVSTFRHDLMYVLRSNGMNTKAVDVDKVDVPPGKRIQIRKRRLIKDFSIGLMEVSAEDAAPEIRSKNVLARLVGLTGNEKTGSQRWRDLLQAAKKSKIIGNRDHSSGRFGSIKRQISEDEAENSQKETSTSEINDLKYVKFATDAECPQISNGGYGVISNQELQTTAPSKDDSPVPGQQSPKPQTSTVTSEQNPIPGQQSPKPQTSTVTRSERNPNEENELQNETPSSQLSNEIKLSPKMLQDRSKDTDHFQRQCPVLSKSFTDSKNQGYDNHGYEFSEHPTNQYKDSDVKIAKDLKFLPTQSLDSSTSGTRKKSKIAPQRPPATQTNSPERKTTNQPESKVEVVQADRNKIVYSTDTTISVPSSADSSPNKTLPSAVSTEAVQVSKVEQLIDLNEDASVSISVDVEDTGGNESEKNDHHQDGSITMNPLAESASDSSTLDQLMVPSTRTSMNVAVISKEKLDGQPQSKEEYVRLKESPREETKRVTSPCKLGPVNNQGYNSKTGWI